MNETPKMLIYLRLVQRAESAAPGSELERHLWDEAAIAWDEMGAKERSAVSRKVMRLIVRTNGLAPRKRTNPKRDRRSKRFQGPRNRPIN